MLIGSGNNNYRIINTDGRSQRARSAAMTTTRSTTAGRWASGKATRWWSTRGASTRISGSPTAACRTPTSCGWSNDSPGTDFDTLKYDVTVEDPGAYTRPWSSSSTLRWVAGEEMPRHLCQDNRS